MKTLVILASGRGSNAAALIDATGPGGLLDGVAEVACVACNVPGAGVLDVARARGIPVHVVESRGKSRDAWERELVARVPTPDLWALAGFMRILSPGFVARFAGRVVNVHPADTSQHQGLGGYAWAFEQRLDTTYVTVHLVDEGLDTGRVLHKAPVDLRGASSLAEVEARGLAVEHAVYPRAVRELLLAGG